MCYSIWLCSKRIIFFSTSQIFHFWNKVYEKKGGKCFFVSLCTTHPYRNSPRVFEFRFVESTRDRVRVHDCRNKPMYTHWVLRVGFPSRRLVSRVAVAIDTPNAMTSHPHINCINIIRQLKSDKALNLSVTARFSLSSCRVGSDCKKSSIMAARFDF